MDTDTHDAFAHAEPPDADSEIGAMLDDGPGDTDWSDLTERDLLGMYAEDQR